MADLRQAIVSHERGGASRRDLSDMNRLADLVERLHGEAAGTDTIDALRSEIAQLREAVIDNNIDGTVKTLELGYGHIVQRLDELRRMVGDPRILNGLDDRLVDIENTLANLPKLNEFQALEDRLGNLSDRLERAANQGSGVDVVHLENEIQALRRMISELDVRDVVRSVDDRLRGVAERIGELEHALTQSGDVGERITAMEQRLPETDAFDRLNHRLERICTMLSEDRASAKPDRVDARLSEIVGRLDSIERRPADDTKYDTILDLLATRIDALTDKLDAFNTNPPGLDMLEAAARRIDDAVERVSDTRRYDDLQSQIGALVTSFDDSAPSEHQNGDIASLRRDVAELRRELTQPDRLAEILEPQIRELARALTSGDRVTPDDAALARIEQQIAVIAGQLDATEDRLSGLGEIEAALGQIGGALSDGRHSGAVESPGHTDQRHDDIDALRGDLSRLMRAAGAGSLDADAGVAEIQSALNAIVDRLSMLEDDAAEVQEHAGYAMAGQGGRAAHVTMPAQSFAAGATGGGRGGNQPPRPRWKAPWNRRSPATMRAPPVTTPICPRICHWNREAASRTWPRCCANTATAAPRAALRRTHPRARATARPISSPPRGARPRRPRARSKPRDSAPAPRPKTEPLEAAAASWIA
ncbi:hypothetical protein [Breoghania sp. L-A4]|uniref:hypothetical protein n=1 Tax=Breoghania sp. L-A4 TaxID=2304600 RepID=UPI0013C31D58|nr:hypothetical protein [Breoghania sp. L-A4]